MKYIKLAFLGFVFFCLVSCARQGTPNTETAAVFNAHLSQGADYLSQGSYARALEEFRRALTLNPASTRAHNLSGLAYFWQKDYRSAEDHFLKAITLNPSFATAYNNLGGVYAMQNQWDSAEKMLKKAISLSPDMVSAHFSLGAVLFNLGRVEEGTAYFAKAIALDPDYLEKQSTSLVGLPMSGASLSEIYFVFAKLCASNGNTERAVEFLKKARQAGFHDWQRIVQEKEFEKIRDDPGVRQFLKD
jgi:Tfp pilus assembly protein PilF